MKIQSVWAGLNGWCWLGWLRAGPTKESLEVEFLVERTGRRCRARWLGRINNINQKLWNWIFQSANCWSSGLWNYFWKSSLSLICLQAVEIGIAGPLWFCWPWGTCRALTTVSDLSKLMDLQNQMNQLNFWSKHWLVIWVWDLNICQQGVILNSYLDEDLQAG